MEIPVAILWKNILQLSGKSTCKKQKGVKLPDKSVEDEEKARNVLAIVAGEYPDIHLFSQKYYQATAKTFLATTK